MTKFMEVEIRISTPWVYKPVLDLIFLVLPGALSVIVIAWAKYFNLVDFENFSYFWLVPILLLDASHFWSTIFRTYLSLEGTKNFKKVMIWSPIVCYFACAICYFIDPIIFWRLFGYFALYHLMRQQDGLLRVLSRKDEMGVGKKFDIFCIQAFVLLPILYWHFTPRSFFWFDESLLMIYHSPLLSQIVLNLMFGLLGVYLLKVLLEIIKKRKVNLGTISLVLSTFVTWYFGVIYYNSDTIFSITNIVAHGVPYLYIIFVSTYSTQFRSSFKFVEYFYSSSFLVAIIFFCLVLLGLSYFEEFLWDILLWKNTRNFLVEVKPIILTEAWLVVLVPLLALPKMTHYLIDGFIWKGRIRPKGFRF